MTDHSQQSPVEAVCSCPGSVLPSVSGVGHGTQVNSVADQEETEARVGWDKSGIPLRGSEAMHGFVYKVHVFLHVFHSTNVD